VRFFASLREAAGTAALALELPEPAGFEALLNALEARLAPPALVALRAEHVRLARNQELVVPPFELVDGDELAFLPPVTGG
jgi:molybdopterin synthase sulfur carrier subunit